MTNPSPKPAPASAPNTALTLAWRDAEAALLRFKASRDPADREAVALHLLRVAECEALVIVKKHVDTKLPASLQRDKAEMASNAASSVLTQERTRMTLLAENFKPERATLRTLVGRMLFNKVMDYVRKEPLPGMVGGGAKKTSKSATPTLADFCDSLASESLANESLANEPLTSDNAQPNSVNTSGTLQIAPEPNDHASAGNSGAARGENQGEASHDDSNTTLAILREIEKMLTKGDDSDEAEVFACEFLGMTYEDGLEHINQTHHTQESDAPYMSLSTYKRKLAQARKTLAKHYPELGE
jgi:hypothetical protein